MGCDSENVVRDFRTPVGISKGQYSRFDRGLRKTADMMRIDNWKTARSGETAFAGRGGDAPIGTEVLWGAKAVEQKMGVPFATQMAAAARPLAVDRPETDPYVRVNSGMRAAANTLGVTKQVLPPAEITAPMRKETV
jgi:hypothetical protein